MNEKLVRSTFDIDNPPPLSAEERRQLERLAAMPEEDIDLSDIPEQLDWSNAVRFRDRHFRPIKRSTTVRIDSDVLHWLKSKGRGYQTRLNAILREAMKKDVA
jgi:uncharacterized protein (DUF4415 family)